MTCRYSKVDKRWNDDTDERDGKQLRGNQNSPQKLRISGPCILCPNP